MSAHRQGNVEPTLISIFPIFQPLHFPSSYFFDGVCVVFSCFRNCLSNKVRVSTGRGYSTLPYWLMNDAVVQGLLEHLRLRLRACPTFCFVIIITFCFKAHSVFPLLLSCCPVCEGMLIRSGRSSVTAIPQESPIAKHSPAMITVWVRTLIRTGIMAIP